MKPIILSRMLIVIAMLVVLAALVSVASGQLAFTPPLAEVTPPLPPTPGPEPTLVPQTSTGKSVLNTEEVIERVLIIDRTWVTRAQPLTRDQLTARPDNISIEKYETRGEASTIYGGGHSPDSEVESEPVWVVIIKGKVAVKMMGLMGSMHNGEFETDGVTYIISQRTGDILEVAAGILQKVK